MNYDLTLSTPPPHSIFIEVRMLHNCHNMADHIVVLMDITMYMLHLIHFGKRIYCLYKQLFLGQLFKKSRNDYS